MKRFLLKALDVILTIIMVISATYSIFNLVMTFLPGEVQATVYNWLNMSQEYIATFSISSAINAGVLVAAKVSQTLTRINLTGKLASAEKVISQGTSANEVLVEKLNSVINNLRVLQELVNALLSVQKVTTERKYQGK